MFIITLMHILKCENEKNSVTSSEVKHGSVIPVDACGLSSSPPGNLIMSNVTAPPSLSYQHLLIIPTQQELYQYEKPTRVFLF